MFEEVRIRERKSTKHGKTYEYRFEIAPIGGERKWLSKGGLKVNGQSVRRKWKSI